MRPTRSPFIHCNYSCPSVQFVGNNISLRAICLEGSTERSDGNRGRSPREEAIALILPGRQYATGPASIIHPLIALVTIRATDPVAIYPIATIRVHSCNSWAKKIPNNSWAIIFRGISVAPAKDNFKLSQVVPVVVISPLIALV